MMTRKFYINMLGELCCHVCQRDAHGEHHIEQPVPCDNMSRLDRRHCTVQCTSFWSRNEGKVVTQGCRNITIELDEEEIVKADDKKDGK